MGPEEVTRPRERAAGRCRNTTPGTHGDLRNRGRGTQGRLLRAWTLIGFRLLKLWFLETGLSGSIYVMEITNATNKDFFFFFLAYGEQVDKHAIRLCV